VLRSSVKGNNARAFLCLCCLLLAGCRQDAPVAGPGESVQLRLRMSFGDQYRFDRWPLDQYGDPLSSGKLEELWRVTQTGMAFQGQTGVTILTDSGVGDPPATLYLQFTPSGALYQYGFLDRLLRQMGAGKTTPHWDQLLPSELQSGTSWVVGVADTAMEDTVYGSFTIVPEYFSARLNGVSNVFPAYRIDLQSAQIQYTFWVTDSPTCIPAFHEESTGFGGGFEAFLSSAVISGQASP